MAEWYSVCLEAWAETAYRARWCEASTLETRFADRKWHGQAFSKKSRKSFCGLSAREL